MEISDEDIQKVETCSDLLQSVEEGIGANATQEAPNDEDESDEDQEVEVNEGTEDNSEWQEDEKVEVEYDRELVQSLIDSVRAVDLEGVRNAIDQGAPVSPDTGSYPVESVEDKWGDQVPCGPLEFAALHGHVKLAKLLLEKGAKIDRWDNTIEFAIRNKHLEAGIILREHCEPAQWDAALSYMIEDVIKAGDLETLQLMIDLGLQFEKTPNEDDLLPLTHAAKAGQTKVIDFLLDHGADVHAHQDEALYCALEEGRGDIAEYLIEKGAMLERRLEDLKKIQSSTDSPTVIRLLEKRGLSSDESPVEWKEALEEYARSTCVDPEDTTSEASADDENEDREDNNNDGNEPTPDNDNPSGTLGESNPPPLPVNKDGTTVEPPYPPLPEAIEKTSAPTAPDTESYSVESESGEETKTNENSQTHPGIPAAPPMFAQTRQGAPMPGTGLRTEPVQIRLPDHLEPMIVDKEDPEIQLAPEKAQGLVDQRKKEEDEG